MVNATEGKAEEVSYAYMADVFVEKEEALSVNYGFDLVWIKAEFELAFKFCIQ